MTMMPRVNEQQHIERDYHKDGVTVFAECTYKHGNLEGPARWWRTDGTLMAECVFEHVDMRKWINDFSPLRFIRHPPYM